MATTAGGDAYAYCRELVRARHRDRYLSALFAPAERRDDIYALYAFACELSRVREVVSDPLPGEVRLQWWRDMLDGTARGEVARNPVAAALAVTIERRGLPVALLLDLVEARICELYDDPVLTVSDLEIHLRSITSGVMEVAARLLGVDPGRPVSRAAMHAGIATAAVGVALALPRHSSRGRVYLPEALLARHGVAREEVLAGTDGPALRRVLADVRALARDHYARACPLIAALPRHALPAFLTMAPVPAQLRRMERPGYAPFDERPLAQWRRQWIIWRTARRGFA